MAFIWYAGTPSDYGAEDVVSGSDTLVGFASVTLDIYTERSTSSTLLDNTTMQDAAGSGIDQVTWAVADLPDGIWFKADTDTTGGRTVFGTPDAGTTWYMFHPDNKHNVDRVAALESAGVTSALDDLTDVTVTGSEADGTVLTRNSTTGIATFQAAPALSGAKVVVISDGSASTEADGTVIVRPSA